MAACCAMGRQRTDTQPTQLERRFNPAVMGAWGCSLCSRAMRWSNPLHIGPIPTTIAGRFRGHHPQRGYVSGFHLYPCPCIRHAKSD